jgi:predicted nucleotide-binding protein (sugar kinase/HSP70/actin superfamily)
MKTLLKAWNWIFFPSMVDMHQNQDESTHLCPYCEHIPFMVRSVLETHLLTPPVLFNSGVDVFVKSMGPIKKILGQDDGSLESVSPQEAALRVQSMAAETRALYE